MDEMSSPETVTNALQVRQHETASEKHLREAIAVAEEFGFFKARIEITVLRELMAKANMRPS